MLRHSSKALLVLCLLCGSMLPMRLYAEGFNPTLPEQNNSSADAQELPLEDIQQFVSIYNLVKENYVATKSDQQLFEQAIQGLVSGLDPYSRYLNPDQYQALLHYTEGDLATVDFKLQYLPAQQLWQIQALSPESDAYAAGLRNGQVLSKLEQQNVSQLAVDQVPKLLLGSIGSSLSIQTTTQLRPVNVLRTLKINAPLQAQLLSNQVLVVQVGVFQQDTAAQLKTILQAYSQRMPKALLIDLRNNPGGLLSAAVESADVFLSKGVIVSTKSRAEGNQQFQALPSNDDAKIRLGVLLNARSASAAEVFAAALQAQQRAWVIGERSYGKGVVQKLFPLPTGAAVQMTVSHYYTPKGEMIDGKGVQPNVPLAQDSQTSDGQYLFEAAERLLQQ